MTVSYLNLVIWSRSSGHLANKCAFVTKSKIYITHSPFSSLDIKILIQAASRKMTHCNVITLSLQ